MALLPVKWQSVTEFGGEDVRQQPCRSNGFWNDLFGWWSDFYYGTLCFQPFTFFAGIFGADVPDYTDDGGNDIEFFRDIFTNTLQGFTTAADLVLFGNIMNNDFTRKAFR